MDLPGLWLVRHRTCLRYYFTTDGVLSVSSVTGDLFVVQGDTSVVSLGRRRCH